MAKKFVWDPGDGTLIALEDAIIVDIDEIATALDAKNKAEIEDLLAVGDGQAVLEGIKSGVPLFTFIPVVKDE